MRLEYENHSNWCHVYQLRKSSNLLIGNLIITKGFIIWQVLKMAAIVVVVVVVAGPEITSDKKYAIRTQFFEIIFLFSLS